jgi:riboflavin kinase/FMN adenylyltransferase
MARPAITNIGVRPTFGGGRVPVIETHVFDEGRDLYDRAVRLWFVQRLRDERAFDGVEALTRQIEADCAEARHLPADFAVESSAAWK